MAHWEHRDEAKWKSFKFNQPYAKGLKHSLAAEVPSPLARSIDEFLR